MSDRPSDEPHSERLEALERKLAKVRKTVEAPKPRVDAKFDQANMAWRMVIELVTGLGLGGVLGYGLDHLLGTMPLMMIVFIFLGLAAGIKTMMRTASELDRKSGESPDRDERD